VSAVARAARAPHTPRSKERLLTTPEGVSLRLELAGGGERVGAFALDLMIMFALLILVTILVFTTIVSFHSNAAWEASATIWLLGFFVLRNFYFVLFEASGRGATPGKRAMKIRVAARDGGRLAFGQVLARNLMRELEFFLPLSFLLAQHGGEWADSATLWTGTIWTVACALIPWFNRDRLRAGDLVAGSWVVHAPRPALLPDVTQTRQMGARALDLAFTDAQLDAYGVFELQTLEDVLRRDDDDAIAVVAQAIRTRIGWSGRLADEPFLAAYYAASRARMERGLLFGKRRRDKRDTGTAGATA